MDRRGFLAASLLGSLGAAAPLASAQAFQLSQCPEGNNGDAACRRIAEHEDVLKNINAMLEEKGLDAAQRQAVLASATCPFCGSLLIPAANGGF